MDFHHLYSYQPPKKKFQDRKPHPLDQNFYVYAFWSVCIYIHMCNVCIELFIYILVLKFAISAILP